MEEQRAARLAQNSRCQWQRIFLQTSEERQLRLQLDAELHLRGRAMINITIQ